MRLLSRMMLVGFLCAPLVTQAQTLQWSACQTVTAVSNYLPYNGGVYLTLSPGITGCTGNSGTSSVSAVGFVAGQAGVTSSNVNAMLATALTALTTGDKVTVYYDSSSVQCYSQVLAIKGYLGQCP